MEPFPPPPPPLSKRKINKPTKTNKFELDRWMDE